MGIGDMIKGWLSGNNATSQYEPEQRAGMIKVPKHKEEEKLVEPKFPLHCGFCSATHKGPVQKAVDDDWNFGVFDTKSMGTVQKAGCPRHAKEFSNLARNIITANPEVALGIMKNNQGIAREVKALFHRRVNEQQRRKR